MAQERVQKILAQAGIASRRKAEEMIQLGEVTINGKLAKLGDKADLATDSIKVRGKLLHTKEAPVYIALYKPKGAISAMSDPDGRPSLTEVLQGKVKQRVYPIGRLDFSSEGLILMTNDGAFAEKLQKMEGVPRVYHIKVRGRPDPSMIARLEKGARLGNRLIKPHSIRLAEELANKVRIEIVLTESGAVDVKTLFEQKGFLVESIRRTAIGQITLRGLKPAEFRYLKPSQVEALITNPELGLRNIPDEGQLQPEGQGFRYRRPQGDPATTLAGKREAAAAQREGGAKPALPRPRGAGATAGASKLPKPKSATAGAGLPKPRTGGRTASRIGIRVTRKKSTRG
jgi:23S rRNA pseudouridine2605 synthase